MGRFVDVRPWELGSEADYFMGPEVGSSYCSRVLGKSGPSKKTGAFGSASHLAVYQPEEFTRRVVCPPEECRVGSGTGQKARLAQWTEEQPSDALIVPPSEYETAKAIRESVHAHPIVRRQKLWEGAQVEQPLRCTDSVTGLPIRLRPDWRRGRTVLDLKSTSDPSDGAFFRSVLAYLYHLQAALYCDVLRDWTGHDQRWGWIAVGKTPPHLVAFYRADEEWLATGRKLYSAALRMIATARDKERNVLPWWTTRVLTLGDVPEYARKFADEHEAYAEELTDEQA